MDRSAATLGGILAYFAHDEDIPLSLLRHAGSPCRTWSSDGQPETRSHGQIGISSDLIETLSITNLQTSLDQLCARGNLHTFKSRQEGNLASFKMNAGAHSSFKHQNLKYSHYRQLQALLLVRHAFPVDVYLEDEYGQPLHILFN